MKLTKHKISRPFKRLLNGLFNRLTIFAAVLALQLTLFVVTIVYWAQNAVYFYWSLQILSLLIVIWLARKDDNPSYKLGWTILIMLFPLLGGLFYLVWGNTPLNRTVLRRFNNALFRIDELDRWSHEPAERLAGEQEKYVRHAQYITELCHMPLFEHTSAAYFPLGEDMFVSLLEELEKAEKFIFLEFFIIQEGKMWDPILEILKRKAACGVDVRLIYDDAGCLLLLNRDYPKMLRSYGIRTLVFNRLTPMLNRFLNYRNHRKIVIIDGNVGYMGGINLADEYINAYEKHGHWKDTAVKITGDAVFAYTCLFLQMWQFICGEGADHAKFMPTVRAQTDGFVLPFSDSPLDDFNIGEISYMQVLNAARDHVYITTPYLILDNEMITALSTAARSGVDVRIITPGVADKWYVHLVTQSYYKTLINAGVHIYEYTPGFMHAKMVTADGEIAIIGTINMDFRSFYLHFECGTVFYNASVASAIETDFLKTLKLCHEISLDTLEDISGGKLFLQSILRIFAPLM